MNSLKSFKNKSLIILLLFFFSSLFFFSTPHTYASNLSSSKKYDLSIISMINSTIDNGRYSDAFKLSIDRSSYYASQKVTVVKNNNMLEFSGYESTFESLHDYNFITDGEYLYIKVNDLEKLFTPFSSGVVNHAGDENGSFIDQFRRSNNNLNSGDVVRISINNPEEGYQKFAIKYLNNFYAKFVEFPKFNIPYAEDNVDKIIDYKTGKIFIKSKNLDAYYYLDKSNVVRYVAKDKSSNYKYTYIYRPGKYKINIPEFIVPS